MGNEPKFFTKRRGDWTLDEQSRFWPKVEKGEGDSCWIWRGSMALRYGLFLVSSTRVRAHRFSYEVAFGPIPEGMVVCHRCDNPPCVRPDHLFLGTQFDNMRDLATKGRHPMMRRIKALQARTHCPNGHEFSEKNTRWEIGVKGRCRVCRKCRTEQQQAYIRRKGATA